MIISLHIPKSAGTSFRFSLKEHFGSALLEDYGTRPLRIPFELGRKKAESFNRKIKFGKYSGTSCIHGHFLAAKYSAFVGRATFITWLRNPVDRLYSNYYHILRNHPGARNTIPFRVRREGWTLEEYCFSPLMKNYCSNFFWNFDISAFEFIGIVENYETELDFFFRNFLGSGTQPFKENTNPDNEPYRIDPDMRNELEKFHALDMSLYNRALDIASSRR